MEPHSSILMGQGTAYRDRRRGLGTNSGVLGRNGTGPRDGVPGRVRRWTNLWQTGLMSAPLHHPEADADRQVDRRTWVFVILLVAASCIVNASSLQFELRASGTAHPGEPWVRELASHLSTLVVTLIVPWMLSRAPVSASTWRWALPAHLAATVVYSALHVLLMVSMRKLTYPVLFDWTYEFGLMDPAVWLYEYRKDALTYTMIALGFAMNRLISQGAREAAAARSDARAGGRLTLKCGGRTIFVDASDVIAAQAASNYVEIRTVGRTHLARMTLADLEHLLSEAGNRHVRTHRSHIVNVDHIDEIVPKGEGDVAIHLSTGDTVPGSRRYRSRLPEPA